MEYLDQAAKPYRSNKHRRKFIENARDSFMRAHGQARDQFSKARIQYQLGVCWVLLGGNEDARYWFNRAYEAAMDYWTNSMIVFMSQILLLDYYSGTSFFELDLELDNDPLYRVGKPNVKRFMRLDRVELEWREVDEHILAKDKESSNLFDTASPLYGFLDALCRLQNQADRLALKFV